MPPRRLVFAFLTFWFTLGVVVLVASAETFLAALRGVAHAPSHVHLAALAGAEAVAAALFLVPRTMRIGAFGLLATFAIALAVHALAGQFPIVLLVYAAGTAFVLVHGPVPWDAIRGHRPDAPHA